MARRFGRVPFTPLLLWAQLVSAQQPMAPHPLGPVLASAPTAFGNIQQVRELPDGRVLVNDPGRRTLVVVDSTLGHSIVVLDSASGKDNSYGPSASPIFAFRGDSILFADARSRSFLVLSPALRVVRTMSAPPTALGTPRNGFERWSPTFGFIGTILLRGGAPCAAAVSLLDQCEAGVIATDVDSHRVDTLVTTYDPQAPGAATEFGATADDWVVTSDGSLAILRTREYRIEWVNPDGSHTPGTRVPFDWRRLDDAGKGRLADSLNQAHQTSFEAAAALWALDSTDVVEGRPLHPRLPTSRVATAAAVGGLAEPAPRLPPRVSATAINDNGVVESRPRPPTVVAALSLPDYLPPVDRSMNQFLADRDNRVWVRSDAYAPSADGSAVYDIVNRAGVLVDRVRVPARRTVVGFGVGGVVFLSGRDGGLSTLEKIRVR